MELLYKLTFMEYLHGINSCNLIHGIESHWVMRDEELRLAGGWPCSSGGACEWKHTLTYFGGTDLFADPAGGLWIALRWTLGRQIYCENVRWNELTPGSSQWRALLLVEFYYNPVETVDIAQAHEEFVCSLLTRLYVERCVVFGWHSLGFIDMDCWVTGCSWRSPILFVRA
jgi:hypothetical protein